jgi:phosphoglycolate phosphatase
VLQFWANFPVRPFLLSRAYRYLMRQPTQIEIINRSFRGHPFKCVVFDFDGTISLLREQWPDIMTRFMVETISAGGEASPEVRQKVAHYVSDSAGYATIDQMHQLVTLVEKYSQAPADMALSAEAYKELYDRRLVAAVNEKLDRLAAGRLALTDLIVPGVVQFLELLARRGVVLYVASTTDRRFLRREAEKLKVATYFQKIYGPDPTLPDYSKDWLVGQVIKRHGLTPVQLLVVGDGQVEIAVAKKHGGVALGVASTEAGDGMVNRQKREMLIRAGADLIVPDFSDYDGLAAYLFGELS